MSMTTRWADRQVELARELVAARIWCEDFGPQFLKAQNDSSRAREILGAPLGDFINDLLFALSNHSPFDDERLPDQLDDEQLRAVVAQHLADYDAGRYDPSNG